MRTVLGLLRADSGEILVNGERAVYGKSAANRSIGYLPDVPEFYSFMTAEEYLRFCGELLGMRRSENEVRGREMLALVGLAGEKHRIKGFSRGMKQRLGIAAALLGNPRLLICDEPTSALDPVGRREILDILSSVREQTTVLFSTHLLADAERICTDVAILKDGKAETAGKLREIKTKSRGSQYRIETKTEGELIPLLQALPALKRESSSTALLWESENSLADLLRLLADRRISPTRIERLEPTLEELFMEVTE
jgi:ABC-2 type transport system ATP-binding protein